MENPAFEEFKFAVVFFVSDQTFECAQLDWTREDHEKFIRHQLTLITLKYNNQDEDAVVMQIAIDELGLESTAAYLASVRHEKNWGIEKMWKSQLIPPVKTRKRRRVPPVAQLSTDSECPSSPKRLPAADVPIAPLRKIPLPEVRPSTSREVTLNETEAHPSEMQPVPAPPQQQPIRKDEILKKLCYLEALLEHEFKRLHVRLDQIEGNPTSRRGANLHPVRIATRDAYEDVCGKLHDGDYRELLVRSLAAHGGVDEYSMSTRCVNFLLEENFQQKFSWLGRRDNMSFSAVLGPIVLDAVIVSFPHANIGKVEKKIARYLTTAKERNKSNETVA